MFKKVSHFIFFGNYFVGLLAVSLNIETAMQLKIPFNAIEYYVLLFFAPILYYTYAYQKATAYGPGNNLRSNWYWNHRKFIVWSQRVVLFICLAVGFRFVFKYFSGIFSLPFYYYVALAIMLLMGLLYYGLLFKSFRSFNLRQVGWLKAFIIGLVWACCANVLPLIFLQMESKDFEYSDGYLWTWLFVKNWMFCAVNAIIFDIKDYPTDANRYLRTFVVRLGLRKTIFYVLIPLLCVGVCALCIFAYYRSFTGLQLTLNLLPFLLTIFIAYTMHKRKNILFYLVIIDGIILFKAICGIIGSLFAN